MDKRSKILRQNAIEKLKKLDAKPNFKDFDNDIKKLLEELSIYQIELEHQNKELQEAYERIEKSEKKYKDLFNRAPVSYLIIDDNSFIHDFNSTALVKLGIDNSDIGKIKFHKYVYPDDQDKYYLFFKNNIKKNISSQLEIRLVDTSNKPFYALLDILPDFDKENDSSTYRIIITDIQHQKSLELDLENESEKLRKSELKFRQFIERSHDIFFYLDLETTMIDYVSPNVEEITGFTVEYCKTLNQIQQDSFIGEKYKGIFEEIVNNLTRHRNVKNYTYERLFQLLFKSGSWHWVEGSFGLILDEDGNPKKLMGSIHDITKRIENEQQLIMARDRAEESERLKSAFLANMSHEIRTPMNGIIGFAQILKSIDKNSPNRTKYLDIIEKSGERLLELINNLIDISKYESGQMKVKNSRFELNELFNYLSNFFTPEAENKNLVIEYECDLPDNRSFVFTDKEKVYALLTNLIKNSIKYTDEGSIKFGYKLDVDNLHFFVKDTGIGIPQNKLNSIFNRFVQVDSSLSSNYEGAGLGLAICKAYTDLLGGKIGVKSELNEGSEFYFELPVSIIDRTNEKADSHILIEENDPTAKYQVLIADDDYNSRLLLEAVLSERASKKYFANDGKQAVEIIKKHPEIDIIFMDMKMPKMDGFKATRIIRESNKEVKIVAQTAFALSGDRQAAIEAGCNDYVSKPILPEMISVILRRLFSM